MKTPRLDKSTLPDPSFHWTTRKASVFLATLVHRGQVAEAARVVGMSRQSAYRLRGRLGEDSLFAHAWDKALREACERRRAAKAQAKATALPPESDIFGLGK